jgi:hypothetical protein
LAPTRSPAPVATNYFWKKRTPPVAKSAQLEHPAGAALDENGM